MSIFDKFAIIFSRFKKCPCKIYNHLLSLRFSSNTQFMYIYELMMTELSQFVIIMDSKYSKVGINTLACRLCCKWCQTFGGRCIYVIKTSCDCFIPLRNFCCGDYQHTITCEFLINGGCNNTAYPSEDQFKLQSRKISFVHNINLSCSVVWNFCTEHDGETTVSRTSFRYFQEGRSSWNLVITCPNIHSNYHLIQITVLPIDLINIQGTSVVPL